MQRRAAEESLTDHGKDNSNGRAHVGDAIRHKPGILGFLRQIGFMGATGQFFDPFSLFDDGGVASKVGVGWSYVADALVVVPPINSIRRGTLVF